MALFVKATSASAARVMRLRGAAVSPAVSVLREADRAFAEAAARATDAATRAARLRDIIAAAAPAEVTLQQAVAADAGEDLSRFAAGKAAALADLITASETASRAASIARAALPAAETAAHQAGREVHELGEARKRAAAAVLVAYADTVGQAYLATFCRLAEQYDELLGIGRALAALGRAATLAEEPIEAPRFELPSMPAGEVFSRHLRHAPSATAVATVAAIWSRAARALFADPAADLDKLLRAPLDAESAPPPRISRQRCDDPAHDTGGFIEGTAGRTSILLPAEPPRSKRLMRILGRPTA